MEPVDVRSCFYTFTLDVSKDTFGDLVLGGNGVRWQGGELGGRAAELIRTSLDHRVSPEEFILDF